MFHFDITDANAFQIFYFARSYNNSQDYGYYHVPPDEKAYFDVSLGFNSPSGAPPCGKWISK